MLTAVVSPVNAIRDISERVWAPEFIIRMFSSYFGKKPETSNETTDNMSHTFQTNEQKYERQSSENSHSDISPGSAKPYSNSVYTMRSDLRTSEFRLRNAEDGLKKEQHRYRSLEGQKNKLQTEHKQQKVEIEHLQNKLELHKDTEQQVHRITDRYISEYARKRNIPIEGDRPASYRAVLIPMLNDALQAHFLRSQVSNLKADAQVQQDEFQALQIQFAERRVKYRAVYGQVQSLQEDVKILQKQLLNKVEKVQVVSDNVFSKDFCNLSAMVKSLSRSVRINQDMNMWEVLDNRGLLLHVHNHHWSTRARKKYFTEAWIWSVLLDHVFKTPFTILGETGAGIAELWSKLFGNTQYRDWPSPSASCENWRCTTVEHAVASMEQDTGPKASFKMADDASPQEFNDAELQMRNDVANLIGTRLANLSTAVDLQLIPKIIEAAFALGLQMSLQRSRLRVTFPNVDDRFDRARMASNPGPDGEDTEDGVVAFIVRPGLTKWGDAHGKHFDQRYDIVPSLVQLQPRREYVAVKLEVM